MTLARMAGDGHNPYGDTAMQYREAGWNGPLPLPYNDKFPPPTGYNKRNSEFPTIETIERWCADGQRNICVRCAEVDDEHEVIGIDVDEYAKGDKEKRGHDQLQKLVESLGPLPATWTATARTDGRSGIRFFRVPRGLDFRGKVDKDIEVIRKGHRYAVVWPSVHPDGMTYWWYPPGREPISENRSVWDGALPDPRTFEKLPESWVDFLTNHQQLASVTDVTDADSSVDEIYGWADATFHGDTDTDTAPCGLMRQKLDSALKKVRASATYHDLLTNAHWNFLLLAFEGHQGWNAAINEYEAALFDSALARGGTTDRTEPELRQEIWRSRVEALRKIKGKSDERVRIGAAAVDASCLTVGCGNNTSNVIDFPNSNASGVDDQDEELPSIFRRFGPTDWAQPVPKTQFLIKRVLSTDTWGVNGGPEKSLKTHDNQAIGLAVATGSHLYCNSLFPVERPGKVVYIVGEGGANQVRRTLHRMLRAYGVKPEDVARDPDFPFAVFFGAAPLDSYALREELKQVLDEHQPSLVLMESFYNFHPASVNAANLYERGQVIDSYHKLIRSSGTDVVSLLTDHNKKGANELGLRQISMSGQAENSDSWIQRKHRNDPDVQSGNFWLTTSFNGRDWGGTTYDVDWHLGLFDHDANAHVGDISWDVSDHSAIAGAASQTTNLIRQMVTDIVSRNPFAFTRNDIQPQIKAKRQDVLNEISAMIREFQLYEDLPKNHGLTGKAKVLGPMPLVIPRQAGGQTTAGNAP